MAPQGGLLMTFRATKGTMITKFGPAVFVVTIACAAGLFGSRMSAQTATKPAATNNTAAAATRWTPTRTPDGQPDLQGIWLNFDATPFEAPAAQPAPPSPQAVAAAVAIAGTGPASEFADHNHK